MTDQAYNTTAAAAIAGIAVRAKLRDRNDPTFETACLNDVIEAVDEAGAMMGLHIDAGEAVIQAGAGLGMKIRLQHGAYRVTYCN